jgi:hypothetical protein
VLWIGRGWHDHARALLILQLGLAVLNIRASRKTSALDVFPNCSPGAQSSRLSPLRPPQTIFACMPEPTEGGTVPPPHSRPKRVSELGGVGAFALGTTFSCASGRSDEQNREERRERTKLCLYPT